MSLARQFCLGKPEDLWININPQKKKKLFIRFLAVLSPLSSKSNNPTAKREKYTTN